MNMIAFSISLLLITISLIKVDANGEFSILHHPRSISFKGQDDLRESTISDVYSVSLGFSNSRFSNWKGIFISDPFYLAEAIVCIYVEGVQSIDQVKGHHFPLKTDSEDENIFVTVRDNIILRYPEAEPQIINIDLGNGLEELSQNDIFEKIKYDEPMKNKLLYLKNNAEEDREFLREVNLLNSIANKITSGVKSDGTPDFFWFEVSGLHPLVDLYGDNSTEVKEAKQLLNEALHHLCTAFKKVYKGAVLFSVIASDASHTRKIRSVSSDTDRDLNLASDYSENFPVIFNIILWLCVILGFSLLAISLFIGNMDPGRDSVIYRMTNPRMKKDN